MSDRRKDMWRLLYNLVNRSETQLGEVFLFIDDILCKEPSLIRQSSKEATNNFQDAFILWLINKLVCSLHVEQQNDADIFEINLKIQRKLLNSCLVNRSCLFEKVIRAYSTAIGQLSEAYSEVDFSLDTPTTLTIKAFSIHYKELKVIDPDISFPIIKVQCEKVEDYIQAMLQVLHHGLFVGYLNYPSIFADSILNVLKAVKEFDLTTKIICIQYVGKLFQRTMSLSGKLYFIYELCFRSIVSIWQYLPMWLSTECLSQELLDDFLDVSSLFLKTLYTLSDEISEKHIIESYCFQLIENINEVYQYKNYQTLLDISKTENMLNLLIDFMFCLHMDNSSMLQKINPLYITVLLKVVKKNPKVLRAVIPHLMFAVNEEVFITLTKFVTLEIKTIIKREKLTDNCYRFLNEWLSFLFLMEHLFQWHIHEIISSSETKSKNGKYFHKAYNQIAQIISASIKEEDIKSCLTKNESNDITHCNKLKTIGLVLCNNCFNNFLSPFLLEKLIEILIKPITAITLPMEQFNPIEVESSLDVIVHLQQSLIERFSKKIKTSLAALGKFLFSKKNDNLYILTKYTQFVPNFIVSNWLTVDIVANELLKTVHEEDILLNTVKALCCLKGTSKVVVAKCLSSPKEITAYDYPKIVQVSIECENDCNDSENLNFKVPSQISIKNCNSTIQNLPIALKTFVTKQMFTNPRLLFIKDHIDFCGISHVDILDALFSGNTSKPLHVQNVTSVIRKCIKDRPEFLTQFSASLLFNVTQSFKSNRSRDYQRTILTIISSSTQSGLLSEQWLYHFFKMTFFYLIHPESKVVHEAILCALEVCNSNNVKPIYLWNWYKRDALNLIVRLMVYVYLSKGTRMTKSLSAFTKMLGFSCVEEFVCKYYRLLVTMILPFCVKEPRCKGLIISISKITRKSVVDLFVVSFLRIYTHIYLTEEADVGNLCIELIGKCTGSSLSKLMNTDIQQTVCEFLVYFNRSPTFVMQAFRCLLPDNPCKTSLKSSSHEFTEFIKLRFLGVITYFQTCLSETFFEKPLKEETLYSLGQIMRLIGSQSVTEFRFKIIAMLSFVLTINDRNMQNICLKIWNIFLHIVSIEELGPSLSRIVASLLPLIDTNTEEINSIYEYLILKNDSLLGIYIPDLYFLEGISKVKPVIKQSVARQLELSNKERGNVSEKLRFLHNQICNENLEVRIYGLNYLASFIALHRKEINHMILDTIPVDPLIERIVDELIKGCRLEERNMHLASAKCLGELGAIDPSYMSSSFSFRNSSDISLSILTDDFAIMALTELCRAYQFQKDSKYVDNFSLAIQETLSAFGISPDENKKLNIWEALPVRMQHIMRPLLSSCYTGSKRQTRITDQPLFNSSFCRSYEEWSFAWSCRLIDLVEKEDTRQLLNSYKLSMKRDSNILAIFFPYILLHVLQECPVDKTDQIYEEFMAVLNFGSRDICLQTEVDTFGYKEFKSTKYSADGIVTDKRKEESLSASERFEEMETVIHTCTKLCSELIDFLQRWVGEWQKANSTRGNIQENKNFNSVTQFLARFNKSLISKANFNCGEYSRALLYLEEYIEEDPPERIQDQLSFLIQIHGKLMDSDSVEGAVYIKKVNLTLEEEILVNRLVDRPQETITCYEQLLSKSEAQINQDHIKGIIDCYLRMDTPETALLITDGLWQKLADQYTDDYFKECKSELLWRLGRYDELQELLEDTVVKRKTTNWNIQCAESFLLFRQPHVVNDATFGIFIEQLNVIRSNIVGTMRSCSGITGNAYTHSYDEATRLHLLNEVEKTKYLTIQVKSAAEENTEEVLLLKVKEFFNNWDARLEVLQPTARVLEPILCFRRNLLLETQRTLLQDASRNGLINKINECINEQIVKLWLRSIQVNRESGCLQQAQICIMKAEQYKPATLFLEKAKLLWQKNDQANCFKLLQKNIQMLLAKCNGVIRNLDKANRIIYAEAKFLQAYYNAESMNICQELNLAYYKEAVEANQKSEKCQVHYAQYMEKIYDSLSREHKESENGCNILIDIMFCYARSLKFGCANVYQSLPRLLSIWLNFTSHLATATETAQPCSSQASKHILLQGLARKMNELISNCATNLPASIFFTALSQLLSRICHPSPEVFKNIKNIVMKLIEQFPQQALWMLLPVFKSCHNTRVKRCRTIFTDPYLNKPSFQKLLNDFNMLTERLIELTNKDLAIDRTYELSTLVRQLPRLFMDRQFSKIMLPFEKYMQASFPITSSSDSLNFRSERDGNSSVPSNPFPSCVYICGISEEVVVLRSAAKPKKITIECNDGLFYNVMIKPKDDLRKDFRLMEFNGLVKRFLHQDPQARHRRLRIRTYAAIPFNEECGLVEWLPNLNTFRSICISFYRIRNLGIPDKVLRQYVLPKNETIEKKRSVFNNVLLARHPPVFHEWFRQRFPSPHCWYQARSSFVKTVAVMSMVGYILGLGDRHGENILLDETNGDAVHVDFNCLFNQGEIFAYPEVVPFRLTHNMVFAMGPLGVEGLFRKCCEITLRVLKGESKTLMSVLKPFVYDIGSINRLKGKSNTALEITDPKAITDVKRIEERLQGYVKRTWGCNMPLSTEGHVNFLINEATDIDNLSTMYIGWGAFI